MLADRPGAAELAPTYEPFPQPQRPHSRIASPWIGVDSSGVDYCDVVLYSEFESHAALWRVRKPPRAPAGQGGIGKGMRIARHQVDYAATLAW